MTLINIFFWIILLLGAILIFLIVAAQAQAEAKARQQLMLCLHEQRRKHFPGSARVYKSTTNDKPEFRFYIIDRSDLRDENKKSSGISSAATAEKKQANKNICA